ncbi:ribose 1,5-bisphosphate isomerase [Archaeoglobus sulfaticallidus PM70-1]|uniref:Ribose 1,5-bisphosphate isomerase n=1 Tax=Archaeoglobus sulfaticallidus PM70-1 TaxID=387631 RepID=N0BID8_9EURY|nr:ribose 1,5-bisphosphate isomerase [Archaeoglobus sulfaticallidus]AGK60231.1 ribose 1,5-bisphosphate isomerase [Archaeoglobus sulfaticallidus PM70-1]
MSIDYVVKSAEKIKNMEVRGAGRIAKFCAKVLMEYAMEIKKNFDEEMKKAAEILLNTRPTAVSLYNSIYYVMDYSGESDEEKRESLVKRAKEFIEWVDTAQKEIGRIGSRRIKSGSTILTHCNSASALSVIKEAYRKGKDIEVFATESRPRYQGHLTAKELSAEGIPVTLIVDSAVRYFIREIDYVIVGADAITVNGSLVNKIGTSQIALIAKEARVPFMVAAETYKFSPKTLLGESIVIEERDPAEVAPEELRSLVKIRNPAFDITPRHYIDLIITEIGAIPPEMAYLVIKERLGYRLLGEDELKLSVHHYD